MLVCSSKVLWKVIHIVVFFESQWSSKKKAFPHWVILYSINISTTKDTWSKFSYLNYYWTKITDKNNQTVIAYLAHLVNPKKPGLNVIKISQIVQSRWSLSMSILAILAVFINFLYFVTFLCYKETNDIINL